MNAKSCFLAICFVKNIQHSYLPGHILNLRFFYLPSISERPKIWIPRNLRQTIIKKVGETINLVIPFQVRINYLERSHRYPFFPGFECEKVKY